MNAARPASSPRPAAIRRAGLSLIECMISLAIAAALLTAVAAAFSATTDAMQENDTFFQATHTGRVALNRMLTQIRRGLVDDNSTATNLRLITESGQDVTYRYLAAEKRIVFVTNYNVLDPDYTLARQVEACEFNVELGPDHAGDQCVLRVTLVITVKVGKNQILFSGSAAPRRNFSF